MILLVILFAIIRISMLCKKHLKLNSLYFRWYKSKWEKLNNTANRNYRAEQEILIDKKPNQTNNNDSDGKETDSSAFLEDFKKAPANKQYEALKYLKKERGINLRPGCRLFYINSWVLCVVLVIDVVIITFLIYLILLYFRGSTQIDDSTISSITSFPNTEVYSSKKEKTMTQVNPSEENEEKESTEKSIPPTTFEPRILSCPSANNYKRNISQDDCRIWKSLGDKIHGYQLKLMSCGNANTSIDHIELSIYRFSVFDSFPISLQNHVPMIKTIVMYGEEEMLDYVEDFEIVPSAAFKLNWPAVENITFYGDFYFTAIFKAVESWNMPQLNSVHIENSLLLKINTLKLKKIFHKYSENITTLILQNVSLCETCEIFNGDFNFFPMYKTILNYNNPSKPLAIQQTERLIWIAPYLRDFETNAEFSQIQIGRLPKMLPCLQRVEFAVVLDLDENIRSFHARDRNLNLSLNCITQFPNLTHATLNVKVKDSSLLSKHQLGQSKIIVEDTKSFVDHKNLKSVKINSCSSEIPLQYVINAKKMCPVTMSFLGNSWNCTRS